MDVKVIMLDLIERDVFKNCFLEGFFNICLYYILRWFYREIICEKLGIIFVERLRCFEFLFKFAYVKFNKKFDIYWVEIKVTKRNSVIKYLKFNWLLIKY